MELHKVIDEKFVMMGMMSIPMLAITTVNQHFQVFVVVLMVISIMHLQIAELH
jgi:hypothetical protein